MELWDFRTGGNYELGRIWKVFSAANGANCNAIETNCLIMSPQKYFTNFL
jgi:hypothetical protein